MSDQLDFFGTTETLVESTTVSTITIKKTRVRKVKQMDLPVDALSTTIRAQKTKKKVKDRSLRALFQAKLAELDIEALKKPWMSKKSFVLIDTDQALIDYVDRVLADRSAWRQPYLYAQKGDPSAELMPVVAVDTETHGLDTRIMVDFDLVKDYETGGEICVPIYEVNIEIAGVCLSHDGVSGIYIPIFHEKSQNVSLPVVHDQLQRLFDQAHLVFYNAKFDREVMRQTLGIAFRPYPYYEDVQVLQFSNDPKAKIDEGDFAGGDGLKGLSKVQLGMEQISLSSLTKVQAHLDLTPEQVEEERVRPKWRKLLKKDTVLCHKCSDVATYLRSEIIKTVDGEHLDERGECSKPECLTLVTYKKPSTRVQHAPFHWVPTHIALWYAASDAICTWLLWEGKVALDRAAAWRKAEGIVCTKHPLGPTICGKDKDHAGPCARAMGMHEEAQSRKLVHIIDGELIDTLTWMERQRFVIDTDAWERLVKWHNAARIERNRRLQELAVRDGWQEISTDEGTVISDSKFNVDSPHDLPKLLFSIKGFTPTKFTEKGAISCDAEAISDLHKLHPHDEFLNALLEYKEYVALHPENLAWDRRDKTARIYLKQTTVAGGRLSASGGTFLKDGGFGMNIQAIKSVGGNWWVKGDVLVPDNVHPDSVEEREEGDLHPSCFVDLKNGEVKSADGRSLTPEDADYEASALKMGFTCLDGKWVRKAPGIIKNHIANYIGYSICLVPGCKSCSKNYGVLIAKSKLDANQIINLRGLFIAEPGFTMFSSDYANIEMRVASNISGEPEFIAEFLERSGDFHTLTASKVFPEFNDPNTSKARKKELRSLAKIINFALLYGGTMHTIYENMRREDPNITLKQTQEMVEAYWRGVPVYRMWCGAMQKIAREELTCTTPTNRGIKFDSAMAALGIRKPTKDEMNNYFAYLKLRKEFRELEAKAKLLHKNDEELSPEDTARTTLVREAMDVLWKDPDTGVRNASEHGRFMSKIQRVAVNVPLQGLAGDFMRMSLNRIRRWANSYDPLVQSVLRVHGSVHDEIDYAVKNEYVPFVVPRITRMMKLRKMHANRKWPVPIEADTEYGRSWDVAFHLTGDSDHKPSGWTDIAGLENYIPDLFDPAAVDNLVRAIASGKDAARDKAEAWLKASLHPRSYKVSWHALWTEDKNKVRHPLTDVATIRKQIIACLQLHEYWMIDETPDADDDTMETLLQYEARRGLTAADRGYMPEGGWLAAIPLDRIRRKPVPILGDAPVAEPTEDAAPGVALQEAPVETINQLLHALEQERIDPPAPETDDPDDDEEILFPAPKKRVTEATTPPLAPPMPPLAPPTPPLAPPTPPLAPPTPPLAPPMPPLAPPMPPLAPPMPPPAEHQSEMRREEPVVPKLRTLYPFDDTDEAWERFDRAVGRPYGENTLSVLLEGQVLTIDKATVTEIPEEFLIPEFAYA